MGSAESVFLNSGIFGPPIEQLTVDGYDLQFGTNVLGMYFLGRLLLSHISDERSLGHFYFAKLLLPALQVLTAAKSSPGVGGRVINTTSLSGPRFQYIQRWAGEKEDGQFPLVLPEQLCMSYDHCYCRDKILWRFY